MLGLFRRGRIDDATLDQHLDLIDAEAAGLHGEIEQAARDLSKDRRAAMLQSAESLLTVIREKLTGPISPGLKGRIIEIFVERVPESAAGPSPLSGRAWRYTLADF